MPTVVLKQLELLGLEHLRVAIGQGKGAILWESSCFRRRLLAKQILHNNGFAVDQVHGENHLGGFGHAEVLQAGHRTVFDASSKAVKSHS